MRWDVTFTVYDFDDFIGKKFSARDVVSFLNLKKTDENFEKVQYYLMKKNKAFTNTDDFYSNAKLTADAKFISKNSFIKDTSFVVLPSKFEIEKNILIFGSRFNWITMDDPFYYDPVVRFNGTPIRSDFIDMPYLQGSFYYYLENETDYLNTILNQHPYNSENFARMNPQSSVKIKVLQMDNVYRALNITVGDRLRIRFPQSTFTIFEIENKKAKAVSDIDKKKLQICFDEQMKKICFRLKSLSTKTNAISNLFFLENKTLFSDTQVSIEELIKESQTISVIEYGYESLLWPNNFPEPVINDWCLVYDVDDTDEEKFFLEVLRIPMSISIINVMIEKFLYDSFLDPTINEEYFREELTNIFFADKKIPKQDIDIFFSIINTQMKKIKKDYNAFSDPPDNVKVRNEILHLYMAIVQYAVNLRTRGFIPSSFSNQQGICLNNMLKRLIAVTELYASNEYPYTTFLASLDNIKNMRESFDMIRASIDVQIKNMKLIDV